MYVLVLQMLLTNVLSPSSYLKNFVKICIVQNPKAFALYAFDLGPFPGTMYGPLEHCLE